jgi:hypothetical protein
VNRASAPRKKPNRLAAIRRRSLAQEQPEAFLGLRFIFDETIIEMPGFQ